MYLNNVLLLVTCLTMKICTAVDDIDGQLLLHVYHTLGPGPDSEFEPRGFITVQSSKSGEATYFQDKTLTNEDVSNLKKLADSDGYYRIKVVQSSGSEDNEAVFSFTKACAIYQSELSDELRIALDPNGQLMGVAIAAVPAHCNGDNENDVKSRAFNTTVVVLNTANGPAPDTLTYIQRMEQEKAEKARGEQGDDRSFFAKYWMYIVPFVIFLFISGASGPENQGGSGR